MNQIILFSIFAMLGSIKLFANEFQPSIEWSSGRIDYTQESFKVSDPNQNSILQTTERKTFHKTTTNFSDALILQFDHQKLRLGSKIELQIKQGKFSPFIGYHLNRIFELGLTTSYYRNEFTEDHERSAEEMPISRSNASTITTAGGIFLRVSSNIKTILLENEISYIKERTAESLEIIHSEKSFRQNNDFASEILTANLDGRYPVGEGLFLGSGLQFDHVIDLDGRVTSQSSLSHNLSQATRELSNYAKNSISLSLLKIKYQF